MFDILLLIPHLYYCLLMITRSTLLTLLFLSFLYLSNSTGIQCNVADCQSCSSVNFCGLCNTNFMLQLNATSGAYYCQQVTCPNNCLYCYQNNICQKCSSNFFLNSTGQCVSTQTGNSSIPSNCLYGINNSTCQLCSYGYSLQSDGFCYPMILNFLYSDNCLVMLNSMSCQICLSGYIVNNFGACSINPNNVACNVTNCLLCSQLDNCSSCASGFQPMNGSCIALPCSVSGCQICTDSSNCQQCMTGYIQVSTTSCRLPSYGCNVQNCQQCQYAQSCAKCAAGYQTKSVTIGGNTYNMCNQIICPYNISNCAQCGPNIKTTLYFQEIICLQCNTGYILTNGYCFANLTVNSSVNSTYQNPACGGVASCNSCSFNYFCQSCQIGNMLTVQGTCQVSYCSVANCASCYITNFCYSCNPGYDVYFGLCFAVNTTINCNLAGCNYCFNNNTCQSCMNGYTLNASSGTCDANCPVNNCWQCLDASNCNICNPGFSLTNNACNAITPACPNCAPNHCNFNPVTNASQCSSCNTGFTLYNGMCYNQTCNLYGCSSCATWMTPPMCVQCKQGLLLAQGQCIRIPCNITNCANCLASSTCLACNQGFYLQFSNNQYTCVNSSTIQNCNVSNCLACVSGSSNQCMTCAQPYIEYNGNCVCKFQNCIQCSYNRQICNSCPSPLIATYMNPNCVPAPNAGNNCKVPNCIYCLTPWRCSTCAQGFNLVVNNATNSTCAQNNCSTPNTNCISCDSTGSFCFQCSPNYQQNSFGSCEKITNISSNSTNYQCNIEGCLICNPSNLSQCQACIATYYLSNSTCKPVNCSVSNCLFCLSSNTCTVCNIGYYLSTNLTCIVNNASNQVSCNPNMTNCFACVQNGSNSSSQMCVLCNFGYQVNPTTHKCVAMKNTIPNCKIQTYNRMGLPICYFCQQGYYLNSYMQCVLFNPAISTVTCDTYNCAYCPMDNYCSYCFIPWNNTNGTCTSNVCNTGCATCTSPSNCLSCIANYTLQNNSCVNCNIPYCMACSPPGTCANCTATFVLSNNKCVCNQTFQIINGSCQCAAGFIQNNGSCVQCNIAGCSFCQQANVCAQCMASYNKTASNTCILCNITNCAQCSNNNYCSSCSGSLVVNSNGNACVTCSISNCTICSSSNVCSTCNNGLILLNNACISCNVQNCLSCSGNNVCFTCASGYTLNNGNGSCFLCSYPCATCNTNGTCATCQSPFSLNPNTTNNNTCYQCGVSNCLTCSSSNTSMCTQCITNYAFVNGSCQFVCANLNCLSCTANNNTNCTNCATGYYINSNNSCTQCPDAPACKSCNSSNPSICITCASGYYLNSAKECSPCQSFCSICTSATTCTQLVNSNGQALISVNGQTVLAVCGQGCQQCSQNNVAICTMCSSGFYLSNGICLPCSSSCQTCSGAGSNNCTSCYSNTFLSGTNCLSCNSNCLTCLNSQNPSSCTSCNYGFYLNTTSSSCVSGCPLNCLLCSNANVCTQCQTGYTLFMNGTTSTQCVLCISSCRQCATGQPSLCLSCGTGFYLSGSSCISCSQNCQSCNSLTCTSCAVGYYLNSGVCAPNCIKPCSTCSNTDATSCRSCIAGYSYSNTSFTCTAITSCNGACSVCPLGFNLLEGQCSQCASNCSSCVTGQSTNCTSCLSGYYLSGTKCLACSSSCTTCAFSTGCITCALGYTTLGTASQTNNMQCLACESPCATCQFGPSQCISCVSGYALQGWKCTKTFYFFFTLTLNTDLTNFNQKYLAFLQALANAFGAPNIDSITMNAITTGSVVIGGAASPNGNSGSSQATSEFNGLQTGIAANGNIAGMPITSSSTQVIGGALSPTQSNNLGLILGICIPIGVLLIVGIGLYIYCKKKRSSDVIQKRIKQDSGLTVRQTFELSNMQYVDETGRRIQAL